MCIRDRAGWTDIHGEILYPYAANQVTFKLFFETKCLWPIHFLWDTFELHQVGTLFRTSPTGQLGLHVTFTFFTKAYTSFCLLYTSCCKNCTSHSRNSQTRISLYIPNIPVFVHFVFANDSFNSEKRLKILHTELLETFLTFLIFVHTRVLQSTFVLYSQPSRLNN